MERNVDLLQCEAHLLLQHQQPLQHDRTEGTTEEAIETNSDSCAVDAHRKLVVDATIAEEARESGKIAIKRPPQAGEYDEPCQPTDPVALPGLWSRRRPIPGAHRPRSYRCSFL